MKFLSKGQKQTFEIAKKLAEGLRGGEIILIKGFLGAGKTVFCKGLAAGLNIKQQVTSPTFTVMNVYEGGRLTLCHCDAYRLIGGAEDFGLADYAGENDTVTAIEWPENLQPLTNGKIIKVEIELCGGRRREINID